MEGSALDRAYTAALEADTYTKNGDFVNAEKYFMEAATAFEEVLESAPNNPAARTLQSLTKHHRSRAEYFRSDAAQQDKSQQQAVRPSPPPSVPPIPMRIGEEGEVDAETKNSLPKAATPSSETPVTMVATQPSVSDNETDNSIAAFVGKSLGTLFQYSTAAFVRAFEQSLTPAEPSDSFYVAAPPEPRNSNQTGQGGTASGRRGTAAVPGTPTSLTSFDRAQALENAIEAQKIVLEQGVQDIVKEISLREQRIYDGHTAVVDRMRAENDQLNIQVTRLKERWQNLKESARKRQSKQE